MYPGGQTEVKALGQLHKAGYDVCTNYEIYLT